MYSVLILLFIGCTARVNIAVFVERISVVQYESALHTHSCSIKAGLSLCVHLNNIEIYVTITFIITINRVRVKMFTDLNLSGLLTSVIYTYHVYVHRTN
jgi:hypothetical protein